MAIFTRGKSTAINSPRYLTLRHARRSAAQHKVTQARIATKERLKDRRLDPKQKDFSSYWTSDPETGERHETKQRTEAVSKDDSTSTDLLPGQEKLNSYWAPGLEAGSLHKVVATQLVEHTDERSLRLVSEQDFFVDAPQFSLPPGSIYSVYPPHGYPDDHRILPHVVLSDPHLPWERMGSPASEQGGNKDTRNKVPWLVLFTFTSEELKLADDAFGVGKSFKHTNTLAVNMTVGELRDIPNVANPVTDDMGPHVNDASGDFIFMKPELFKNLFSSFDKHNRRWDSSSPETTRYKYLAHVREINTQGMAVASVEEIGIFSIVVGSRAGPLDNMAPVSVFAHLVSIEGVEGMSFPTDKDYVALCSLYSWTYTVMPPGMVNIPEAFENIGSTLGVLRPPDTVIDSLEEKGTSEVQKRIAARLRDGYSMVRYHTQTGEQTVALYRGPLVPTIVEANDAVSKVCSNSGEDLQILDREVGIMDISYSSAWNLGRSLALGNQAFAAALFRLRAAIHTRAMKALKIAATQSTGGEASYRSREDVIRNLEKTVEYLNKLHVVHEQGHPGRIASPLFKAGPLRKRWLRPRLKRNEYPPLHYNAPKIKDAYLEEAIKAAKDLAKATDGSVYDETNTPVSTDWMIVLAFVLDRMFLSGVPAHYLISDPSHLPPESLRFFYIDPDWVDALIDGVLSLANHSGEDRDRVAIKAAINAYLEHHPEHHPEYTPQVPRYGFYLRSDLVSMFPDLRVEVQSATPVDRAPLLRHDIVADGVMMGLVDRQPGLSEFNALVFTQPPHQQRFAAARKLTKHQIHIDVRKQYTIDVSSKDREKDALAQIVRKPTDENNWFVWSKDAASGADDVRLLRLPHYAVRQLELLQEWAAKEEQEGRKKPFDDDTANSALLAMQLVDPIYSLTVKPGEDQFQSDGSKSDPSDPPARSPMKTVSSPFLEKPRTLRSTLPSRISPLVKLGPDSAEGSHSASSTIAVRITTEDDDDPSVASTFTRHEAYIVEPHASQPNLGPHVRALPFLSYALSGAPSTPAAPSAPRAAAESSSASASTIAGPPTYDCAVYSLGDENNYVQTSDDNRRQDLIFSIHVGNNANSSYELSEFRIVIELGPPDKSDHRLLENYDGVGARMLSNLRFNVLPSMYKEGGIDYLVLRLLPRSVTKRIGVAKVWDLSFLLCLAQVNKFVRKKESDEKITLVTLETEAWYRKDQSDEVKRDEFNVVVVNDDVEATEEGG